MNDNNHSIHTLGLLAQKLAGNPGFMAYVLATYKSQEGLDDEGLARRLGTLPEMIVRLALCKRPDSNSADFDDRISELSDFTLIEQATLAEIVQRADDLAERDAATHQQTRYKSRPFLSLARPLAALRDSASSLVRSPGLAFMSLLVIATVFAGFLVLREYRKAPADNLVVKDRETTSPSQTAGTGSPEASESLRPSVGTTANVGSPDRSVATDRRSPELIAKATVKLDFDDATLLRDAENVGEEKMMRLAPVTTRFVLTLAGGSPKGLYSVSIVDAFGKPLVTRQGRSLDGRKLVIFLNMQGLFGKYRLSVSRTGEAPDYYALFVSDRISRERNKR